MHNSPPGARPRLAAGRNSDPAVVKLEVERRAGGDILRFGDYPRDSVADHDITAGEQAFVALGMGSEPPRKTVEHVVAPVDETAHCGTEPRLNLGDASAGSVEIGGQHRRPQPGRGQIEAMSRRS